MPTTIDNPAALKAARKALGMTCAELAEFLRLQGANGAGTVREMESGKRAVSGPIGVALECALEAVKLQDRVRELEARLEGIAAAFWPMVDHMVETGEITADLAAEIKAEAGAGVSSSS